MTCSHKQLSFQVSELGFEIGYPFTDIGTKILPRRTVDIHPPKNWTAVFPAPLILPDDDLAQRSGYYPQPVQIWRDARYRNPVTPERRTIYVVDFPSIQPEVEFMSRWSWPKNQSSAQSSFSLQSSDIIEYIRAFYGLPVKVLPSDTLKFRPWEEHGRTLSMLKSGRLKKKTNIGLEHSTDCLGIETRPSPDGHFERQLNLSHILEAAMDIVPTDAYALLLLMNQDLYEDEEDDFCCGRAYGGSRVCVVSTARYNPVLDDEIGLNIEHAWPNSHCIEYIRSMTGRGENNIADHSREHDVPSAPLRMASDAVSKFRESNKETSSSMWLGRVCRTASHELGHCFGMGHCVYYACAMQGTTCLAEDLRQPPYMCPIDGDKLIYATSVSETHHLQAMLRFCEQHKDVELFVAYAAWIKGRLRQIEAGQL